jgi:hypothetical protein
MWCHVVLVVKTVDKNIWECWILKGWVEICHWHNLFVSLLLVCKLNFKNYRMKVNFFTPTGSYDLSSVTPVVLKWKVRKLYSHTCSIEVESVKFVESHLFWLKWEVWTLFSLICFIEVEIMNCFQSHLLCWSGKWGLCTVTPVVLFTGKCDLCLITLA